MWGFQNPVCLPVRTPRKEVRSHHSFVNISPTLVIDTSIERSSQVHEYYSMETQKFKFSFKKVRNWIMTLLFHFELWVEIFCVPTCFHMRIPKQCLSVTREKKSPWLHQYQSYISNSYINGKVFTSTTTWEPKNLILLKKIEIEFWLVPKSWNHSCRSQLEPIWRHRGCIVVPSRVDI